ncbi:hypothetical protein GCM10010255_83710 [Streptomyces coeruleofuscus]|uniref:Uncharacterized protein n=1 Tax=Streptomyces coeruleofuscus TaxID=66879 RepID=A0ABN3JEC1_9ACTN
MPDARYAIVAVLVAATVTWALRALPFAALAPLRESAPSSTSAPACPPASW